MIIRNQREELFVRQSKLARAAFTLMEILVVVAIIVALAGVGGFFLIGQLQSSKADIAKLQAKELQKMCKTYYIKYGNFPTSLDQLIQTPSGIPILEDQKALIDPWSQPYQMQPGPTGPI